MPRIPAPLRARLVTALHLIEKGPSCYPVIGPNADDDQFLAGFDERHKQGAGWRDTWIAPELRRVLAWIDGENTANEIENYSGGISYSPPELRGEG